MNTSLNLAEEPKRISGFSFSMLYHGPETLTGR